MRFLFSLGDQLFGAPVRILNLKSMPSVMIVEFIAQYCKKPGPEIGAFSKSAKISPRLQQCFLHQIVSHIGPPC